MDVKERRKLRACLLCSLIKTADQFQKDGCDNCEILSLKDQPDQISVCTSPNYDGVIAMMKPKKSWVARWQRVAAYNRPGLYAIRVQGRLPESVSEFLYREHQLEYNPRDGSADF